jgi:hypothetical protein
VPDQLQSILIGTAGLTVAALAAVALACTRGVPVASRPAAARLVALGVLVHGCHFAEETFTGFHVQFPELLGLTPWPLSFFVAFNLTWIAIWLASIPALRRIPRTVAFPVWFLAIASAANGVVHPILSLIVAGYFPGLWTSPLAGLLGAALLRTLLAPPAAGRAPLKP